MKTFSVSRVFNVSKTLLTRSSSKVITLVIQWEAVSALIKEKWQSPNVNVNEQASYNSFRISSDKDENNSEEDTILIVVISIIKDWLTD